MKKACFVCLAVFLVLTVSPTFLSLARGQNFGTIRALQLRGEHVVRQKNEFIARVLNAYAIEHELNEQGAVIRIRVEDGWLDIRAVEIVPQLKVSPDNIRQVIAHELYFFTDAGILNLVSELTIR